MSRRATATTILILILILATPADAGNPLSGRVKRLERNVRTLAALQVLSPDSIGVSTLEVPMNAVGGGLFQGSVSCIGNGKVATGGGVHWTGGNVSVNTTTIDSFQANSTTWQASAVSNGATARPNVQVICADLER